ncbi:hypothetical protein V865_004165 [Kwoniella europaea PYCC6329]|uniref:Uncharacterized protein n=1 Tax=Kwoniella europaea PYCC6329 TaxID=1423913 RepID=A0AAX4KI68_9TREE
MDSEHPLSGAGTVDVSPHSDLSLKGLETALKQCATTPIQSVDENAQGPKLTQDEVREYYRQFRADDPGFSVKYSTGDGTKLGDILDGIVYEAGEDHRKWRSTQKFDQDIHDEGGTIEVDGQKYEKRTMTNSELDMSRLCYLTCTERKMIEGPHPKGWNTLSGYPIDTLNEYHELLRKKDASANTELWVHMTGWELEPAPLSAKEEGQANVVDGSGTSA